MKIKDFEKKVWDRDGITVVIRARRTANIGNYRESRANHTMDISDYIKNNLSAYLDNAYELTIIDGFGNEATGGTSVGAIRESYRHWLSGSMLCHLAALIRGSLLFPDN